MESVSALPPISVAPDGSAPLSALPPIPSLVDEALRRADEVVRVLSEARERAAVLETAQVELAFPSPREARSSGARKRVLRRVVVKFVPRIRATRRNGRSSLVVEMSPAGAGDAQKPRIGIDVAPMQGRQDPAVISLGIAAFRAAAAQDVDAEELLARAPVSARFDLNIGTRIGDAEAGDEHHIEALTAPVDLTP